MIMIVMDSEACTVPIRWCGDQLQGLRAVDAVGYPFSRGDFNFEFQASIALGKHQLLKEGTQEEPPAKVPKFL
jgi:hypothetical protein